MLLLKRCFAVVMTAVIVLPLPGKLMMFTLQKVLFGEVCHLGSVISNNLALGDNLSTTYWYFVMCQGKYGVGPLYYVSHPL